MHCNFSCSWNSDVEINMNLGKFSKNFDQLFEFPFTLSVAFLTSVQWAGSYEFFLDSCLSLTDRKIFRK